MIITIDLAPILTSTSTSLSSSVNASATALTVSNNSGFAQDDYILVGFLGVERSELSTISSIAGNSTINTSALKFDHSQSSSITKVFYNQVMIEKSVDNGETWTTTSTINIAGDQKFIDFTISGALPTDIYRTRFYNQTTETYSQYSNWIQASGSVVETIINSINLKLNIGERGDVSITPESIFNLIAEADLEICREIIRLNPNYFQQTALINLQENTQEYLLPIDFGRAVAIYIKYDDNDTARESHNINQRQETLESGYTLNQTHYITQKNGRYYIGFHRKIDKNVTGGIHIIYVKSLKRIYNTSDDLNIPQEDLFVDVLETRVLHKVYLYNKENVGIADRHYAMFQDGLQSIRQIIGMSDWSNDAYIPNAELNNIYDPYGN